MNNSAFKSCDCGSIIDVELTSSGQACKKCRNRTSGKTNPHRAKKAEIKKDPLDIHDFGKCNIKIYE